MNKSNTTSVDQHLKVYRASAGSGKTFTLTTEYLKLLLKNPSSYKNILAVTFTNDATVNMKRKILSALYDISYSDDVEKIDQVEKIREDDNFKTMPSHTIQRNARMALANIVHDYDHFRVETIDSFFQSILRQITHELNLNANLKVDLKPERVIEEAVKDILNNLDSKAPTYRWILDYIEEKIDQDNNWQVKKDIEKFGKNIVIESYLEECKTDDDNEGTKVETSVSNQSDENTNNKDSEEMKEQRIFENYKKKMKLIMSECEEKAKSAANEFFSICDKNGLGMEDFKLKSKGPYALMLKFQPQLNDKKNTNTLDIIKWTKANTKYYNKKDPFDWLNKKNISGYTDLNNKFIDILGRIYGYSMKYTTARASLKNITSLGLLKDIDKEVNRLNDDANRFMLGKTSFFLSQMIDESDVPFIYEKAGTQFKHIMIDEFQDTSKMQWKNFAPLIKNALDSEDNSGLIVGDVKQSIYRWRNSDWKLLNSIRGRKNDEEEEEVKTEKEDEKGVNDYPWEFTDQTIIEPLKYNYRSERKIISFNNTFFHQTIDIVNNHYKDTHNGENFIDLRHAYKGQAQQVPEKKEDDNGYIKVELLNEVNLKQGDSNYNEFTLQRIYENIVELNNKGIQNKDICILVRANKYIPPICKYLTEKGFSIICDDAFELSNSEAVMMIINALRMMNDDNDKLSKKSLAILYSRNILNDNRSSLKDIKKITMSNKKNCDGIIPEEFDKRIDELRTLPFLELIDEIYEIFQLDKLKDQSDYVFCFYDNVKKYLEDNPADITNFLKSWDEDICTKTIPHSDGEGMRITSIHKSKGLEYSTVILPFYDWNFKGNEKIWVKTKKFREKKDDEGNSLEEFTGIDLLSLNHSSELIHSYYKEEYDNELLYSWVDNINIMYVAQTRAVNNLVIISKTNIKSDSMSKNAELSSLSAHNLLDKTLQTMSEKNVVANSKEEAPFIECIDINKKIIGDEKQPDIVCYTIGEPYTPDKKKSKEKNILDSKPSKLDFEFKHTPNIMEFKQSNDSKRFIDDEENDNDSNSYLSDGLIIHSVFSKLKTPDKLNDVIISFEQEGEITDKEHGDRIKAIVEKALENPKARVWFSPAWDKVYTECNILPKNSDEVRRPDRVVISKEETVVIDYKTGHLPPANSKKAKMHKDQVAEYMELMRQMGYNNVKGYIWYIRENKIINVES